MTRPIDAKLLAEMFARAAEIKVSRSGDGGRSGRELLESIFTRARELQLDQAAGREDDTAPLVGGRRARADAATPAAGSDEIARGWNEEADIRRAPPRGVDPDDLVRTRFLERRESAIEEFRSSLEALFAQSDSDEAPLPADSTEEPVDLAASDERPLPDPAALGGSALFTQAAEALFGVALEELEQLVLEAWERRVRGEPSPVLAPPPPADPAASPALASLEDGEPLLTPEVEKALTSSDVDHLLSGFAFEGGNPVPAAEVARRARDPLRPAPAPTPAPAPPAPPAPTPSPPMRAVEPAAPAARRVEQPPTLAWGAPPRDALQPGAPRARELDPFARPASPPRSPAAEVVVRGAAPLAPEPRHVDPSSSTVPDDRAPIALPTGGVSFPAPQDLAGSTVHDEGGPIALPGSYGGAPEQARAGLAGPAGHRAADDLSSPDAGERLRGPLADATIHDDGAPIPLPTPGVPLPDATVHDDSGPIALPGQLRPGAAPFAPSGGDAFAPRGGDAFAPHEPYARPAPTGWPTLTPPGWQPAAPPPLPPGGHTPPPGWQTGTGRHAALPSPQPAAWKTGSGPQPALPQPGWKPPSGAQAALPPGPGRRAGSGAHALGPGGPPTPPTPPPPPVAPPGAAAQRVPAGWPFVEGPAPAAPAAPASGREVRPQPPSGRHPKPAPFPPPGKPKGPPSGEGFDPFAPSWWDERPSDEDLKL